MNQELEQLLEQMKRLTEEMSIVQEKIERCLREDTKVIKKLEIQNTMGENETKEDIVETQEINSLHPQVFEFLDLDTMEEKSEFLHYKLQKENITEKDLDLMAVSVNITLQEGEISDKIEDLIGCVDQLAQWEANGRRR